MANSSKGAARAPHYSLHATRDSPALLPVLLDSRGAQAGKAVAIDGILPGEELFDRQGVAAAGFLKREKSAPHGGHELGFAPDDPALRAGRRQVRDGERTSVRPNHILGPRTMGLTHMFTHNSTVTRPKDMRWRLKFG